MKNDLTQTRGEKFLGNFWFIFFGITTVIAVCWMFFFSVQHAQETQAGYLVSDVTEVVFDAKVYAIEVESDGTQYVGGEFTYAGPRTGHGIEISPSTGAQSGSGPYVNGNVNAVVSDGSGGWYIGGSFTEVGGLSRVGLAHIESDGSVDASWSADVSENSSVNTLLFASNTLYVGGNFSTLDGSSRGGFGALDSNGNVTSFDAQIEWFGSAGTVHALTATSGVLYIGGQFDSAGGSSINSLASFDMTNETVNSFYADMTASGFAASVYTLVEDEGTLYVGGNFDSASGTARNGLAAISLSTESVTAFDPDVQDTFMFSAGTVYDMEIVTNTLYFGGSFDQVDSTSIDAFAAVLLSDGSITGFQPTLGDPLDDFASYTVYEVEANASNLYLGGAFRSVDSTNRNRAAAFSLTDLSLSSWNPDVGGTVLALSVNDDDAFIGANFPSIGGGTRYRVAKVSSANALDSWAPEITHSTTDAYLNAMVLEDSILYVGGYFDDVDGSVRNSLAAFDTTTGNLTSFDPSIETDTAVGTVNSLMVYDGDLYIGGGFSKVSDTARGSFAVYDITGESLETLQLDFLNAFDSTAYIYDMVVSSNTVFIGGDFAKASGTVRNGLAALELTGRLTDFNPNITNFGQAGTVRAISVVSSSLFAFGQFDSAGGSTATSGVLYDISDIDTTSRDSDFSPSIENFGFAGTVNDALTVSSTIFIVGSFDSIDSSTRTSSAAFEAEDRSILAWAPSIESTSDSAGQVYTLKYSGGNLYIGGDFVEIISDAHRNYVYVPMPSVSFLDSASSELESGTTSSLVVALNGTSDEDVTVDYEVTGGTASGSGTDYTLASGTATITAGNSTTSIDVALVDDGNGDSDETVVVRLSNPVEAFLGSYKEHTLTLTEPDPEVQFAATTYTAAESATGTIIVESSYAPTSDVTVLYRVTSGTATPTGTDYATLAGTSTISSGNTTTSISVEITDDDISEDSETFVLTLYSPSGATLGTNVSTTFTITDNDSPGVTVTESDGTTAATEGGTDTYTLVLNTEPSGEVDIALSTTAQASLSTSSIRFTTSTWDTAVTVTLTAVDDATVEGAHTATVTHTATSTDSDYDGVEISDVTFSISDNDVAADDSTDDSNTGGGGGQIGIGPSVGTQADGIEIILEEDVEEDDEEEDDILRATNLITINNGDERTETREVRVSVLDDNAQKVALSNDRSFSGSKFSAASSDLDWTLLGDAPKQKVFARILYSDGRIIEAVDDILYGPAVDAEQEELDSEVDSAEENEESDEQQEEREETCPVAIGTPVKNSASPAVYLVQEGCIRVFIQSSQKYFTHFESWDEVELLSDEELQQIRLDSSRTLPWGPRRRLLNGDLVKTQVENAVYYIWEGARYWITSEALFEALGFAWSSIIDISEDLMDQYEEGGLLDSVEQFQAIQES